MKCQEKQSWEAFLAGEKDAFATLYENCYPDLYSYGISIGMDDSQTRDAIQEVFLRIYSKPGLINNLDTIRAFLFRSVKNYYLNILRRQSQYRHDEIEELVPFHLSYTVEEHYIKEEEQLITKQKVEKILNGLSARQQEIIYLRFFEDMSYEEIAEIMNITAHSARNLLSKAISTVRKISPNSLFPFLLVLVKISIESSSWEFGSGG